MTPDLKKCIGADTTFIIVFRITPFSGLYSATYSSFRRFKIMLSTCGTAKTPISAATNDTPPLSSGMFNVNLLTSAA